MVRVVFLWATLSAMIRTMQRKLPHWQWRQGLDLILAADWRHQIESIIDQSSFYWQASRYGIFSQMFSTWRRQSRLLESFSFRLRTVDFVHWQTIDSWLPFLKLLTDLRLGIDPSNRINVDALFISRKMEKIGQKWNCKIVKKKTKKQDAHKREMDLVNQCNKRGTYEGILILISIRTLAQRFKRRVPCISIRHSQNSWLDTEIQRQFNWNNQTEEASASCWSPLCLNIQPLDV